MMQYRVYLLDKRAHIRDHQLITCVDDHEAVALASRLLGEYPHVEVWHGDRMVRTLRADAQGADH